MVLSVGTKACKLVEIVQVQAVEGEFIRLGGTTPEVGGAAIVVENAMGTPTAGGQSREAESIRSIPVFAPSALRLEYLARSRFSAHRREQVFPINPTRKMPTVGTRFHGLLPSV